MNPKNKHKEFVQSLKTFLQPWIYCQYAKYLRFIQDDIPLNKYLVKISKKPGNSFNDMTGRHRWIIFKHENFKLGFINTPSAIAHIYRNTK
jgi:hypothetical protein